MAVANFSFQTGGPQERSPEWGSSYNATIAPNRDVSRAHADTSTLHSLTQLKSYLVESSGVTDYENNVAQGTEEHGEVLIYTGGEGDPITITDKDLDCLKPEGFLSDNIIDFYLRYLQSTLSVEEKKRVHFLNSFFYTKLVGRDCASSESDAKAAAYERVRHWTKEVDIFEKDFVFIPINKGQHWSLIIICYLNTFSRLVIDVRAPYILHLDSLEGQHEGTPVHIQNYLSQAWRDSPIFKAHPYGDMTLAFQRMNFVQAQIPQQENGYDCGIFLLHFVERFFQDYHRDDIGLKIPHLHRDWFHASEVSSKRIFIQELIHTQRLFIRDMLKKGKGVSQVKNTTNPDVHCASMEQSQCHTLRDTSMDNQRQQCKGLPFEPLSIPREKRKRLSNWTREETSILVKCKKDAAVDCNSRFLKGKPDATNWDDIATEIERELGTTSIVKTGDQCRLRWDTLVKSYQRIKEHCEINKKKFDELTKKEKIELKLATTLSEDWWYEVIDKVCPPKSRKNKLQKLDPVSPCVTIVPSALNSHDIEYTGSTIQHEIRSFEQGQSSRMEMGGTYSMHRHNTTHEDLNQMGFGSAVQIGVGLNLDPSESFEKQDATPFLPGINTTNGNLSPMVYAASTQFETDLSLEPNVVALKEVGATHVTLDSNIMNEALNPIHVGLPMPTQNLSSKPYAIPGFKSMSRVLKSTFFNLIFLKHVLKCIKIKMENLCNWLAIVQNVKPLQAQVQVLELLRRDFVTIYNTDEYSMCSWLDLTTIWKYEQCLKMASTHCLRALDDNVSILDSSLLTDKLTVVALVGCKELKKVDLGNLPRLRSLVIRRCGFLKEVCGWENLRELEWLQIPECDLIRECPKFECLPSLKEAYLRDLRLTNETGLKLDFSQCVQLRRLETWNLLKMKETGDLSTLKCLEELSLISCALESIVGLSGLHSLSLLELWGCEALKRVPDLGHVTSLVELDLSGSGVEEISGVENLLSLTRLLLRGCKHLKRLPYLGHLTALAHLDMRWIRVDEIPGVPELVNLKTLDCSDSKLQWLPDLRHLPRLEWVNVADTPLSRVPSSIYFERGKVSFNKDLDMEDDTE